MEWPAPSPGTPKKPGKDTCQFSVCGTKVTIRAWVRAWLTYETGISVLEDESQETWLCFEHENQVRDARKRTSITIRRSVEGWLWVDNLDHLRFAV